MVFGAMRLTGDIFFSKKIEKYFTSCFLFSRRFSSEKSPTITVASF